MVLKKVADYKIQDYADKLEQRMQTVAEIVHGKAFHDEMSRFLPQAVQERTLNKDKFLELLINENLSVLTQVQQAL